MNQIEAKRHKIEYFSHVIGLITFILLGNITGDNGFAYMAVIIECISLFVLFVNGGASEVIGRLIRTRRKKNQYKEANELHKTFFMVQSIAAAVMMVVYFFLTDILAEKVFHMPFLAVALKLLTPIILLRAFQGVMTGYFQGLGAHMPSVVSALFRQLIFLLFGLLITGKLMVYGEKVSALLNNPDFAGMYGAVGLCLSMVIAEAFVAIFLLIVYIGSDRKREKQRSEEGLQRMETFSDRLRLIFAVSFPEIMKSVLKQLPFLVVLVIVFGSAEDISAMSHEYGEFFGHVVCIAAIPIFVVAMRIMNVSSRLTFAVKKKDNRNIREIIYSGMHYSWASGVFLSVCLAVLAPQLSKVINRSSAQVLEHYYMMSAALIAVITMGMFLFKALHILEEKNICYILLVILNVVFAVGCVVLRGRSLETMKVICFAALAACFVQLLVSYVYLARKYVLQPDMIRGFLIPLVAAGGMGLIVMLIQKLLTPHVSSLMCLLLCYAFSAIIYMMVLLMTRSIRENEVNHVYGALGKRLFGLIIR